MKYKAKSTEEQLLERAQNIVRTGFKGKNMIVLMAMGKNLKIDTGDIIQFVYQKLLDQYQDVKNIK